MFVGHLDTPLVRLANHEVVETDDHHVYEAGGDAAPGDPRRAGRVLSGGYLADFTRVPGWALLVSLGVLIGGVTLALTNRVFIEPEQPSYVAPSETKPMLVGSKWLGVCVLSLAGGALTIQESNPTHLSTFGFLLFTLSVVLGGLLLFYRTLALVAVAVAAIIGIAAAWTTLKTKCLGLCPPTAIETFVTTVIPSAIVCVLGYRARKKPADGSQGATSGRRSIASLVYFGFWLGCCCLIYSTSLDVNAISGPVLAVTMMAASTAGLSCGIDSLRSIHRRIAIAGVVFNIIGLVAGSIWLSNSLPYVNLQWL